MKRILWISGVILLLVLILLLLGYSQETADMRKIREFAKLHADGRFPDRVAEVSVGEEWKRSELIKGCKKNFGKGDCRDRSPVSLTGPYRRTDKDVVAELPFLPNQIVSPMQGIFGTFKNEECEREKFRTFVDLMKQTHQDTNQPTAILLPFPEKYRFCARPMHSKPEIDHVFWVWSKGRAVGRIACTKKGVVPNPVCWTKLYIDNGQFVFSFVAIPAVNLRLIVEQLPEVFSGFLGRHQDLSFDVNPVEQLGSSISISPEAEALIQQIERDMR